MSEKKLSIVIPHFNSPSSLSVLLDSIGRYDDTEIIVVDDHSTKYLDEYAVCVEKYSGAGVRFFINDSGEKSAGAARNIGLEAATGKWVLFSDADDYFLDGMHDTVKKYFDDEEYDIIHFTVSETDQKFHQESLRKAVSRYNLLCETWLRGIEHADSMIRYYFYAPWSKMIRRSMIEKNHIRFDPVRYSNDLMFSTRIGYYADKVTVCPTPIYFHMTTSGSLSTNASEEAFYIKQLAYCDRCDFLREHLSPEELDSIENNEGLRRLLIVIRRRYGLRNFIKYYKLYRAHHLPIFTLKPDEITKMKRQLRQDKKERRA